MEMKARDIVRMVMRHGFDDAVVSVISYRRSYLKITNSKVDSIVTKLEETGSLFVSSRKRVFFTNIDKIDADSINKAIRNAKSNVAVIQPKSDYNGIAQGPFRYDVRCVCEKDIANYDDAELSDVSYAAVNSALSNGASNVAGTLIMHHMLRELATSGDAHGIDRCAFARLSIRAFRNGLSAQNTVVTKRLKELKPELFGKRTSELAGMVKNTARIPKGRYDVIYLQSPAGALLSMANDMACIGNVETGSPFTGKLNRRVANRNLRIYDDGKTVEGVGSSPFDDEGYPTQRTKLIENGVLKNYLHNHSTAVKYGTKSTGNAGLVLPDPSVFVLQHRKSVKDLDALIGQVDKGILVTNTWYTRFSNYFSGDFSTVPRDISVYIERGEPRFAVKQIDVSSSVGIRLSDNMIRMLRSVDCAARDTIQTASWESGGSYFFSPSVLVSGVKVTTA